MKQNYKLSPQKHKEIKELARIMPKIPKMDKVGNPTYTIKIKSISGKELKASGVKEVQGQPVEEKQNYTYREPIPNYMNHEIALIEQYKKHGDTGVEDYKKVINSLYDAMKDAKAKLTSTKA